MGSTEPQFPLVPPETMALADSFLQALRAIPKDHPKRQVAKSVLRTVSGLSKAPQFMPTLVQTLYAISCRSFETYSRGEPWGWAQLWKGLPMQGFDVIRDRCVDHGNVEYSTILGAFEVSFVDVKNQMDWLGTWYSSLAADAVLSEKALGRRGDIVEIYLAALRGAPQFSEALAGVDLPKTFASFCDLCRAVQYLDGHICTGRVKHKQLCVDTLYGVESVREFREAWRSIEQRPRLLAALIWLAA